MRQEAGDGPDLLIYSAYPAYPAYQAYTKKGSACYIMKKTEKKGGRGK